MAPSVNVQAGVADLAVGAVADLPDGAVLMLQTHISIYVEEKNTKSEVPS